MKTLSIKTPAKINLFLFIGNKRPDNYHEVFTLMTQINLYDFINIEVNDTNTIEISVPGEKQIPLKDNTIFKCIELFRLETGIISGYKITLKKNIPMQAGLGGGSGNAAKTLLALNKIHNIKMQYDKMHQICAQIGSDVPFFLHDKPCIATGRGEIIDEIPLDIPYKIILIVPEFGISTKYAYENVILNLTSDVKENIFGGLKSKAINNSFGLFDNSFRSFLEREHGIYKCLKEEFDNNGALLSLPSGSGSSFFGLFKNTEETIRFFNRLEFRQKFLLDFEN